MVTLLKLVHTYLNGFQLWKQVIQYQWNTTAAGLQPVFKFYIGSDLIHWYYGIATFTFCPVLYIVFQIGCTMFLETYLSESESESDSSELDSTDGLRFLRFFFFNFRSGESLGDLE